MNPRNVQMLFTKAQASADALATAEGTVYTWHPQDRSLGFDYFVQRSESAVSSFLEFRV